METLSYDIKEDINLYALERMRDYESLIEFNKIVNYKPSKYSPDILFNAKKYYEKRIENIADDIIRERERLTQEFLWEHEECGGFYNSFMYRTLGCARVLEHIAGLHHNTRIQSITTQCSRMRGKETESKQFLEHIKLNIDGCKKVLSDGNSIIQYSFFERKKNGLTTYEDIWAEMWYINKYKFYITIEHPKYNYDEDRTPCIIEGFNF